VPPGLSISAVLAFQESAECGVPVDAIKEVACA